jgi:hypothetical protein
MAITTSSSTSVKPRRDPNGKFLFMPDLPPL